MKLFRRLACLLGKHRWANIYVDYCTLTIDARDVVPNALSEKAFGLPTSRKCYDCDKREILSTTENSNDKANTQDHQIQGKEITEVWIDEFDALNDQDSYPIDFDDKGSH